MNWDALGAVGELAGAIGVIVTLAFLAIQLRQNTVMMRANIKEQRTLSSQQVLFKNAELAGVFAKIANGEEPTTEEQIRLRILGLAQHRGYEAYVHQHRKGLYDEDEWSGILATIKWQLQQEYFRATFEDNPERFSRNYQNLIRSLLVQSDA